MTVERVAADVKQHEMGMSIGDITVNLDTTFYRRKKEYGGLEPSQVRELKEENER